MGATEANISLGVNLPTDSSQQAGIQYRTDQSN